VPCKLTTKLLVHAIFESKADRYIIDGYPAKLDQVEYFESFRQADLLLDLHCSDETVLGRWNSNRESLEQETGAEQSEDLFRHKLHVFQEHSRQVSDF